MSESRGHGSPSSGVAYAAEPLIKASFIRHQLVANSSAFGAAGVPRSLLCEEGQSGIYTYTLMDDAMTVTKTRTFRSGNSEAVRLPKDVAFGEEVELVIVRSGDVLTLYRAATSIPEMIARLKALPVPPSIEKRDDEELPERAGL